MLTPTGSALTDQITGGTRTYTSDELGGKIYTATLSIPAEGKVRITLSPYVYLQGQTLFGGSYTLIYQNGVYEKTVFS